MSFGQGLGFDEVVGFLVELLYSFRLFILGGSLGHCVMELVCCVGDAFDGGDRRI